MNHSPATTLRDAVRAVAAFRATDPHYADPLGVTLENEWCAALLSFFNSGGTREAADRIEDEAFAPTFGNPITPPLSFDQCEAAGVDGTGRFIG